MLPELRPSPEDPPRERAVCEQPPNRSYFKAILFFLQIQNVQGTWISKAVTGTSRRLPAHSSFISGSAAGHTCPRGADVGRKRSELPGVDICLLERRGSDRGFGKRNGFSVLSCFFEKSTCCRNPTSPGVGPSMNSGGGDALGSGGAGGGGFGVSFAVSGARALPRRAQLSLCSLQEPV